MRTDQSSLERVISEIVSLENRIISGKGVFEAMEKKPEFEISVFMLDEPIYIIGRGARVKHGTPEHQPAIDALIEGFFGDDVPSMIPDAKKPVMRFGICAEFTPETGEFTYMMGDRVEQAIEDGQLPETTRSYIIPAGEYACVRFSAIDKKTLISGFLGEGYGKIFDWVGSSEEWVSTVGGTVAYEVYKDERFEVPSYPEMEIWTPVKKKVSE
jgi:predicted transcriptional regulator YdeE